VEKKTVDRRGKRVDFEWILIIGYEILLLWVRSKGWILSEAYIFSGITFPVIMVLYLRHSRALAGLKINLGAVSIETPKKEEEPKLTIRSSRLLPVELLV